jgi:hypothetical protein
MVSCKNCGVFCESCFLKIRGKSLNVCPYCKDRVIRRK